MGRFAFEDPTSKALLPTWKQQKGMLGIRVAFNHEKTQWIADGTADWLWRAAEDADVPIMIFAPDAPEQIGRIAAAHPRLRLIIDHFGQATRGPEYKRVGPRLDIIAPFAKYPNVTVKLSAVPGFSSEPYPFRDMTPHLRAPDRGLSARSAASGAPTSRTSAASILYRMYVEHFEQELAFLSDADRKLVMGEAILKFLDWK